MMPMEIVMSDDTLHADLTELLTILGMGDHARPQSPHEVFQEALSKVRQWVAERDHLAERLEDKTNSLRTEIAAKVGAYREIKMLEDGIRSLIAMCEQDAHDQKHNAEHTSDKQSKAYAEGRGMVSGSLAMRLKVLIAADDLSSDQMRKIR